MKLILALVAATVIAVACAVSCSSHQEKDPIVNVIDKDSLVKRGEYLVGIMGCNDCHTPRKMTEHGPAFDTDRLLSGHPSVVPTASFDTGTIKNWVLFNMTGTSMVGPWGASYAANLTSDETGIGNWTESQFRKAFVEGKFKGLEGSRTLLPPMPWENNKNVADADVKAIFAYLKSTKPVSNIVPQAVPPDGLSKFIKM